MGGERRGEEGRSSGWRDEGRGGEGRGGKKRRGKIYNSMRRIIVKNTATRDTKFDQTDRKNVAKKTMYYKQNRNLHVYKLRRHLL